MAEVLSRRAEAHGEVPEWNVETDDEARPSARAWPLMRPFLN